MAIIIYFSSATENTHRFVQRLGMKAKRIPLRVTDEPITVDEDYVLLVPSYGGGERRNAVPKQVVKFLNDPHNRALCRGVIASGNTNFGTAYGIAGDVISQKLQVPCLYRYELLGTAEDVEVVRKGLEEFWSTHSQTSDLKNQQTAHETTTP